MIEHKTLLYEKELPLFQKKLQGSFMRTKHLRVLIHIRM